jgi:hypothetical protein
MMALMLAGIGRIQGSIVDTTDGILPGVSVTLQNDATAVAVTRPHHSSLRATVTAEPDPESGRNA